MIVNVLSLGAGVQSSALLLAADKGLLGTRPDFAVFADTQSEPQEVYDWLEKLKLHTTIPIITATAGSLEEDQLRQISDPSYPGMSSIPGFIKNDDGTQGLQWRTCTDRFKIAVVRRAIRDKLGYKPRQRWKHTINMIMGISADEKQRMKISRDKWMVYEYPLVNAEWDRQTCIHFIETMGVGTPPRSACYFCPYKSNTEWKRLRDEHPEYWKKAIEFDSKFRTHPDIKGKRYLHRQMLPLDQVDLDVKRAGEVNLTFDDECAGVCGV